MWDVIANLVYSADGSCVDNVIINGKIVMRNKKIVTVNEAEVLQRVKEASQDMKSRLKIELPSKWNIV